MYAKMIVTNNPSVAFSANFSAFTYRQTSCSFISSISTHHFIQAYTPPARTPHPSQIVCAQLDADAASTQPTLASHIASTAEKAVVPLIIGGGPCGLVTAATLHHNRLPCVLLEKAQHTASDPSRTYPILISPRSRKALAHLPNLLQSLRANAYYLNDEHMQIVGEDGTVSRVPLGFSAPDEPNMTFSRARLVQTLRDYVDHHCPSVSSFYGYDAVQIQFDEDGICVQTLANGSHRSFRTNMLLVCDGRNSTTVHQLRFAEEKGLVSSESTFTYIERFSACSRLHRKTILTSPEFKKRYFRDESYPGRVKFTGTTKNRPHNRAFHMTAFRLPPASGEFGERSIASVVLPKNHALWGISSAQSLYDLLQENFPNTNLTDIIDEYGLKKFLNAKTSTYGPIRVIRSLTGTTTGGCGVVVMGDAAHSFPPDIGQGLSAALEDVSIIGAILSSPYEGEDAINTVRQRYEKQRTADARALIRIQLHGAPYLFDQNKVMNRLSKYNAKMRSVLSRWFPGRMFKSIGGQLFQDLSYAEILRRADLTTARIWGTVVLVCLLLSFLTVFVLQ